MRRRRRRRAAARSDFDPSFARVVPPSYTAALVVPVTTNPITSVGERRWVGTREEDEEKFHSDTTRNNDTIESVPSKRDSIRIPQPRGSIVEEEPRGILSIEHHRDSIPAIVGDVPAGDSLLFPPRTRTEHMEHKLRVPNT